MSADGGEVAGTPRSSCGHRNPPDSRFCDVCGTRLPAQCPHCHAINRAEANFCGSCGAALGNSPRVHATPPWPRRASPDRSPAPACDGPATLETSATPRRAENQRATGPESHDVFSRIIDGHRVVDKSQKTRDLMERVRERRRGARRRWVWLGAASAAVGIEIFGAALLLAESRRACDRSRTGAPAPCRQDLPPVPRRTVPVQAATSQAAMPLPATSRAAATSGRDDNLPALLPRDGEQGRPPVSRIGSRSRPDEAPVVAQRRRRRRRSRCDRRAQSGGPAASAVGGEGACCRPALPRVGGEPRSSSPPSRRHTMRPARNLRADPPGHAALPYAAPHRPDGQDGHPRRRRSR